MIWCRRGKVIGEVSNLTQREPDWWRDRHTVMVGPQQYYYLTYLVPLGKYRCTWLACGLKGLHVSIAPATKFRVQSHTNTSSFPKVGLPLEVSVDSINTKQPENIAHNS